MYNSREYGGQPPLARTRSLSVSSDAAAKALLSPPPVEPSPAFIAISSASQIVSVDMEENDVVANDEDEPSITPNGISLLNGFLDYLLFSFLATSKSTQLSALRPAIADVLKPRLAKEVVAAADEELGEYMGGGGDEEELHEFRGGRPPHGEFDLIRAWKLTRLRCMVYTRLGDLEEEEEDEYIAREGLDESGGAPRRFSGHAGNITPAAAIFLTSIIEYLGEHALIIAGENARNRVFSATRLASRSPNPEDTDIKMTVEESDMEKLALNPTLGRLWRTWKKGIRSPTLSRSFSRESFATRRNHSNKSSIANLDEIAGRDPKLDQPVEEEEIPSKSDNSTDATLPANDEEIDKAEATGQWVIMEEDVRTMQAAIAQKVRPRSLILSRSGTSTPTSSSPNRSPQTWPAANSPQHNRSYSVPVQVGIFKSNSRESQQPSLETVNENEASQAEVAAKEISMADDEPEESQPSVDAEQNIPNVDTTQDRSLDDGDEVVEGQGTYQRPKYNNLSMQKPKKKPSKDVARKESFSDNVVETQVVSADNHPPPTQGVVDVRDTRSTSTQRIPDHENDTSRPRRHNESIESVTHGNRSSTHPYQLRTTLESQPEEGVADSLDASRHNSSLYTESIGAPISTSDESEAGVYRSVPSRTASHTASITSQPYQEDHTSANRERISVQRVHGAASTSQASIRSRRSASISDKDRRPLTPGSTTSNVSNKLKLLIGRHPADVDVPLPDAPRGSSDSGKPTGDEVDETNLDELIKSDETIRYTLTPRSMREIEMPGSPRWNSPRIDSHHDRTNTADLANFLKTTAPPGRQQQQIPSPSASSVERDLPTPRVKSVSPLVDGLRAHPPSRGSEKPSPIDARSPSSPMSQQSNRSRDTMQQVRGVRMAGDSVRDFAQPIRSTGSQGASPISGPASRSDVYNKGYVRNGSDSVAASPKPDTAQSAEPYATARSRGSTISSEKNRQRLQAREAAGQNGSKTSDLIDFIREGPPVASTHRIPRTVAPFRNTMDSEDLLLMEADRDNNNNNPTATTPSLTSTSAVSVSSSRAPLVTKSNPSGAPPIPKKKRRGPRDPYAIDVSDDEDFDDTDAIEPVNPPRQEESLLDFLNSAPPPVNQKAPEPFILTSYPGHRNSSSEQSISTGKSRFRRNTLTDKTPSSPSLKNPLSKKSMTSMRSVKLSSKPQISSPVLQSSGRSSVTTPSGKPGEVPLPSDYASQINRQRGPGFQPSSPATLHTTRQTETSALADFLKNTGPPEPVSRPSTMMSEDKRDSTLSKIFLRRNKRIEA